MKRAEIISMNADKQTVTVEVPVEKHKEWREYWVDNDDCLAHLRRYDDE